MKIKRISIKGFKRFTDLTVDQLPETTKLVLLVGPNGSGKTSLFEAFSLWYKLNGYGNTGDIKYYFKKDVNNSTNWSGLVDIEFHQPQIIDHINLKGKFYFRTAYRNEPDFSIDHLMAQNDPTDTLKLGTLMQNDLTVSENYQRLVASSLSELYNTSNNEKTVENLRNELTGRIKNSLANIFDDLSFTSIGNPLTNGSFFFTKGTSKDFHYKNLSAGEKSVFDLILDIIIKSNYYKESVFFIDEPEAHMHTRLQAKLLKELFNLIPQSSQLWISTHSIGMLKQAEELELSNPGSVVFLDFDNRDFDLTENIQPTKIDKTIWNKFFDLAIADFSQLIAPEIIVFCEGNSQGRKYKDFDAQIYGRIFESVYYNTKFVSIGSSSELENIENQSINVVSNILKSSNIIKFVDRDDKSQQEISECLLKNIKTSKRRHIESYLLDDEIIKKLCISVNKTELFEECIQIKIDAINNSIARGNPADDIKSASGSIFTELKKKLSLTQCGNNKCAFLRDTLAPLVTEDTTVYKELEIEIFSDI
ncbi:AAA family ATPase [Arundinibacter roseus]|uniref:ATP-binding cassette domain-containing protein n=1 Tax=Arundinibacter roseus TaxID=2070510 RepID=A0A4R4KL90_9BACT|nr:ATP-binding protein [Arundinibacter roseus]TDB69117.1 ATP-binding cassette domain-containing protein [Arundinibacter roseus]